MAFPIQFFIPDPHKRVSDFAESFSASFNDLFKFLKNSFFRWGKRYRHYFLPLLVDLLSGFDFGNMIFGGVFGIQPPAAKNLLNAVLSPAMR
jgi:hypothetical protein